MFQLYFASWLLALESLTGLLRSSCCQNLDSVGVQELMKWFWESCTCKGIIWPCCVLVNTLRTSYDVFLVPAVVLHSLLLFLQFYTFRCLISRYFWNTCPLYLICFFNVQSNCCIQVWVFTQLFLLFIQTKNHQTTSKLTSLLADYLRWARFSRYLALPWWNYGPVRPILWICRTFNRLSSPSRLWCTFVLQRRFLILPTTLPQLQPWNFNALRGTRTVDLANDSLFALSIVCT